jgi:CDP-glucose 4,6-dehydratase
MLSAEFWNGRKVFITGHTGFKGSWLALWLDAMGADTTGYALDPPTQPSLYEQAKVGSVVRSIHGDVRDFERLKRSLAEAQPDVVLHMAAQSVVRRSYVEPIETYASNVMGTVNLLEAIRELCQPCVIVNVTSDKCYANREWMWGYREIEPMGGKDPYSSSKACAELVTSAYRESYFPPAEIDRHGVALGSARAGNAIGGGDWTSNQLIPDLIRAFLAGESCLIRSPSAYRPWQFLLEPLRGYLMLAERLSQDCRKFAGAWNFGPTDTDAKPVAWVADELVRLWGGTAAWSKDTASHPREAHALKLDASKSRVLLNWQPALSLSDALMWVVEWYRGFQAGLDLRSLTRSQIDRYVGLLT